MNSKRITSNNIIKSMTLKEKIGQMTQLAPNLYNQHSEAVVYGALRNLNLDEKKIYTAGSILGIGSPTEMINLQKQYLKNSTHQVPLVFMADVIHGYKTIFPVPIALASSFNVDVARTAARISAVEAYTSGIHVVFSPMCDLTRDPRWGRVVEGFGEDVYLTGEMSKAMVEGYTNYGKLGKDAVACCIKHFAGYGAAEGGRDYNTVDMSRLSLFRDYLPAYKKALDGGADFIMTSFNTLDGIPSTINSFLLKDVLRDKWGSKAITIADYDALNQVINHGAAESQEEAALKGIEAGLDIEMASSVYMNKLESWVEKNVVSEEKINQVVSRLIDFKIKLGLFENPYSGADKEREELVSLSEEHLKMSKDTALESVVLLENNGVLPLKKDSKIALIGPFTKTRNFIGPWAWKGKHDIHSSLEEVFEESIIVVSDKNRFEDLTEEEISLIRQADVCLMALGEEDYLSGEAHSRSDISLPNNQEEFYKSIKKISKAVIPLIFGGRPLLLNGLKNADAMMMCWFLGSQSSEAIHDLIFGIKNPSGKLPMSFPRNVGQIPVYYNHFNTGRPYYEGQVEMYVSKYLDVKNTPLYPFGYGLSYSKFEYSNLKVSKERITDKDELIVSVIVSNKSDVLGGEAVQLYIRDYVSNVVRPVQELKSIKKIWLDANESKVVEFTLNIENLSYYNYQGNLTCESGKFAVMVGTSSVNTLNKEFHLVVE
ncbi:MAG: glycoside hydrolase family 3 N-terminal domain-containing protein [Candidatus Izemoplasmatales bacterium]